MAGTAENRKGNAGKGRVQGSLNKKTIAAREEADRKLRYQVELERQKIRETVERGEPARDVLRRLMGICEGAAAVNKPTTKKELQDNPSIKPNPDGSWEWFHAWVKLAADIAKEIMGTETPKLTAVAVAQPPPVAEPTRPVAPMIDGKRGEVIPIGDPVEAMRVYQLVMQSDDEEENAAK